jgi:hypothetical protein
LMRHICTVACGMHAWLIVTTAGGRAAAQVSWPLQQCPSSSVPHGPAPVGVWPCFDDDKCNGRRKKLMMLLLTRCAVAKQRLPHITSSWVLQQQQRSHHNAVIVSSREPHSPACF